MTESFAVLCEEIWLPPSGTTPASIEPQVSTASTTPIGTGTPREIQAKTLGTSRVEIHTAQPMPVDVPQFQEAEKFVMSVDRKVLTVYSPRPARTLPDLVKWIDQNGLDLEDIHLKRPTLEDVFIELTGKKLRD